MSAKATRQVSEMKTIDNLHQQLDTKRTNLLNAKRGLAARELTNPRFITATRKEIARILTAIRANENNEKETK